MSLLQPNESHEYIKYLRALFQERMEREDFCIGQEQVEKLFRELLGEPEPVREYHFSESTSRINAADIAQIMEETFKGKLTDLFDRDDAFYRKMK